MTENTMSTILIADDVGEGRYLLTSLLEGHGYEVNAAANGVEALARARAVPPDLVLTDLMMPMMDGFELCRQWKSDPRLCRIPFVVYTATYTGEKDERLALELGADRFLTKPMENDGLIQVIREVLGQARRDPGSVHIPLPGRELALLQDHNDALLRKLQKKVVELEAASAGRARIADEARQANAFLDSIIENIP
ncbi:MAG: response regulator, partial [Vicinamibacterales bacterium]|nr:response regulator [Vicinamibacterales bacterium]